jgi:hypothetical protein
MDHVYTVKELIEALQQCPPDYPVMIKAEDGFRYLVQLGIDPDVKTVDLFPE